MGVPWKLIAAVAYQESQWKHDSISRTGVKGIMMLTRQTAAFLGVQNRENLLENLWGGAKYLRYLMDEQPQQVPRVVPPVRELLLVIHHVEHRKLRGVDVLHRALPVPVVAAPGVEGGPLGKERGAEVGAPGIAGLLDSLEREIDVCPAGEPSLPVPEALAVPEQYQP